MEKKTHSRTQGTAQASGRPLAPRAGQAGGVPAWRDPQRMLGSVLGQTAGGVALLAIGAVVQHVRVVVSWR